MAESNSVIAALDLLAENWAIDPILYDLQAGRRSDATDTKVTVGSVIFHIPTLSGDHRYVLWKCLWPDCHNCCDRQGRLPLTKDDIGRICRKMGYDSEAEFLRRETYIPNWQEQETRGKLITTLTMISLKRRDDERPEQDGQPLKCRFLDPKGACTIHPDKPGVCWLYPFASWMEVDARGQPVVHATFQFTGDCPGFYLESSVDAMMPVLQEYSKRIYDYNMAVSRTTRENYGLVSFVDTQKPT